jgi:hypothetical protein
MVFFIHTGMIAEKMDQASGLGCPLFYGIFPLMNRIGFNGRIAFSKIIVPVFEILVLPVFI